jgi:hypothetical protein
MPETTEAREPKEWTLMFYFASDNPLAPSIVSQLKALKDAGHHPEANVIARFDPHTQNTPSHIFEVNLVEKLKAPGQSRVGRAPNNPFVRTLVLDKLWGEEDEEIRARIEKSLNKKRRSGQPEIEFRPPKPKKGDLSEQSPAGSLASFLEFCREEYPARRYMLFILGHGVVVGNDVFLFDAHTEPREDQAAPANGGAPATPQENGSNGARASAHQDKEGEPKAGERHHNSLSLKQLGVVLGGFKGAIKEEGQELELVGFHSCSMSGLEVAYELKGKANFMLASQGPAFVGSWPYRQILIRIFNDLNAQVERADIDEAALLTALKDGENPVSARLRESLSDETKMLIDQHDGPGAPDEVIGGLSAVLEDPDLYQSVGGAVERKSKATAQLGDYGRLNRADRRRLNRLLLADAFPGVIAPYPVQDNRAVKEMLTKVFYYILYNSYDFQLAGYSFDLALCDLNRVDEVTAPVGELARALQKGLWGGGGLDKKAEPLARELILLAHWDAQSFWQESYTDLYDFCLRLKQRCEHVGELKKSAALDEIRAACEGVIEVLERGTKDDDDRLVVRSEFVGAEYQYSHGLSVFFPWSTPVNGFFPKKYEEYDFSGTGWGAFLTEYLAKTLRETRGAEDDERGVQARTDNVEREVLELFQTISVRVFSDGSLKVGPNDRTDDPSPVKAGPHDPTGVSGDYPSIKNYPSATVARAGGGLSEEDAMKSVSTGTYQAGM